MVPREPAWADQKQSANLVGAEGLEPPTFAL